MAASWECPSLPMLSLPLKDTAKTTFLGLKPVRVIVNITILCNLPLVSPKDEAPVILLLHKPLFSMQACIHYMYVL